MKCPGNPEHKGVKIIELDRDQTPHCAKIMCAKCGVVLGVDLDSASSRRSAK